MSVHGYINKKKTKKGNILDFSFETDGFEYFKGSKNMMFTGRRVF